MESTSKLDRFIRSHGHRVSVGTAEYGLVREDALAAVKMVREEAYIILGGDVYLQKAEDIQPAYANWHTDPRPGESLPDYRLRSWEESTKYISGYPTPPEGIPLFVLTTAERYPQVTREERR
jgi:hypothetical protein